MLISSNDRNNSNVDYTEMIKIFHRDRFRVISDIHCIIHRVEFEFDFLRENEISFEIHFRINIELLRQMNQLNNKYVYYFDLWNQHEQ